MQPYRNNNDQTALFLRNSHFKLWQLYLEGKQPHYNH